MCGGQGMRERRGATLMLDVESSALCLLSLLCPDCCSPAHGSSVPKAWFCLMHVLVQRP